MYIGFTPIARPLAYMLGPTNMLKRRAWQAPYAYTWWEEADYTFIPTFPIASHLRHRLPTMNSRCTSYQSNRAPRAFRFYANVDRFLLACAEVHCPGYEQ
jgi:hypothetical protein